MNFSAPSDQQSLYIHWPFCPYKCHFCPFVAMANLDHKMQDYYQALKKELIRYAKEGGSRAPIHTIYLGGGTPSTMPNELLLDMAATLEDMFDTHMISEITIEANPGTVVQEQVAVWQKVGITRVSIGVQSLDDTVLARLNRHQKADQVRALVTMLAGSIRSLSVDLIIGLPGVSEDSWKSMVQEVVTWPINHLSVYFLSVHDTTPLYFRLKRHEFTLPPEDSLVDLYHWTVAMLKEHGFYQYEVSSFAQPGHESLHNQIYWHRKPYKGIGVGACSFDGNHRFQTTKNLMEYIEAQRQGQDRYCVTEKLTESDVRAEAIMLAIRTKKGVPIETVMSGVTVHQELLIKDRICQLEQKNYILVSEGRIYLQPAAFALEHEVAVLLTA